MDELDAGVGMDGGPVASVVALGGLAFFECVAVRPEPFDDDYCYCCCTASQVPGSMCHVTALLGTSVEVQHWCDVEVVGGRVGEYQACMFVSDGPKVFEVVGLVSWVGLMLEVCFGEVQVKHYQCLW